VKGGRKRVQVRHIVVRFEDYNGQQLQYINVLVLLKRHARKHSEDFVAAVTFFPSLILYKKTLGFSEDETSCK